MECLAHFGDYGALTGYRKRDFRNHAAPGGFHTHDEKDLKGERYHKAILALSTAFWDAHLKGDKAAKEWLNGEGAKKALAAEDEWELNARTQ